MLRVALERMQIEPYPGLVLALELLDVERVKGGRMRSGIDLDLDSFHGQLGQCHPLAPSDGVKGGGCTAFRCSGQFHLMSLSRLAKNLAGILVSVNISLSVRIKNPSFVDT